MDGLGSNIDAHTRGSDLLRILPRINEEVNEETTEIQVGFLRATPNLSFFLFCINNI